MTFAELCRGCSSFEVEELARFLAMFRAQRALESVPLLIASAQARSPEASDA